MPKRSILLFPKFAKIDRIENIRKLYDPLFEHVRAHLTLVFPFESCYSLAELEAHIKKSIQHVAPFRLVMWEITGTSDGYLFLNVKTGNDDIIKLHDYLYQGILEPYRYHRFTYVPHLTVGRISEKEDFSQALRRLKTFDDQFETVVDEITVEVIDDEDNSIVESRICLKG